MLKIKRVFGSSGLPLYGAFIVIAYYLDSLVTHDFRICAMDTKKALGGNIVRAQEQRNLIDGGTTWT